MYFDSGTDPVCTSHSFVSQVLCVPTFKSARACVDIIVFLTARSTASVAYMSDKKARSLAFSKSFVYDGCVYSKAWHRLFNYAIKSKNWSKFCQRHWLSLTVDDVCCLWCGLHLASLNFVADIISCSWEKTINDPLPCRAPVGKDCEFMKDLFEELLGVLKISSYLRDIQEQNYLAVYKTIILILVFWNFADSIL